MSRVNPPVTGVVVIVLSLVTALMVLGFLLVEGFKALRNRGEEPDVLDEDTRGRIDGDLPCGCPGMTAVGPDTWVRAATTSCSRCGWLSCPQHAGATHLCDPIRKWQEVALPKAEAARVNAAFAGLVNADLRELRRVDEDLARFYVMGDGDGR